MNENDEVIAIKASGQITRSAVNEVPVKGRDTMGVKFVGVRDNDSVVVIALNPEATAEAEGLDEAPSADGGPVLTDEVGTDTSSEPVTRNDADVESEDDGVEEDDSE